MSTVTLYTSPTCHYCLTCKEWLKENNIEYEEVDIVKNPEAIDLISEKTGMIGVPVVQINTEFIVGFNRQRLEELLL